MATDGIPDSAPTGASETVTEKHPLVGANVELLRNPPRSQNESPMLLRHRLAASVLSTVVVMLLLAAPAGARSFRCSVSAEDYGDVVASNINPLSPDGSKALRGSGSCLVATDVVVEGALKIAMRHLNHPHDPYLTSLRLTLDKPGDVDAIEIWHYRVRYPVKESMHGFVVAQCAGQRVTFTLVPHPPEVLGG